MSCNCTSAIDCAQNTNCIDESTGCPEGACPDFVIKQHDTRPVFKVNVEDCDGPMDLTGLVLEASMWVKTKLKAAITSADTSLAFADNIGFEQILEGDIIVASRARAPEYMRITGFDETNNLIQVERGFRGTIPADWKKGTQLRVFRFMDSPAMTEMVFEDVVQIDGTTVNQLTNSFLVYEWTANDTCVAGCFFLEFKLLKMADSITIPSNVPFCFSGLGVEWVRRFPIATEGFLIQVIPSPTREL